MSIQVASGVIASIGEGTSPYLTLDTMPAGTEYFVLSSPRADQQARLALAAAEHRWKVTVYYTPAAGTSAYLLEIRAESVNA